MLDFLVVKTACSGGDNVMKFSYTFCLLGLNSYRIEFSASSPKSFVCALNKAYVEYKKSCHYPAADPQLLVYIEMVKGWMTPRPDVWSPFYINNPLISERELDRLWDQIADTYMSGLCAVNDIYYYRYLIFLDDYWKTTSKEDGSGSAH